MADKVDRVAKLARWLVEEGIVKPSPLKGRGLGEGDSPQAQSPADMPLSPTLSPEGERARLANLAERAARLCKADLVTGMVGEFPELQGLMGGYYAAAQGEDPAVAAAIRDHYKPVGQGDEVPTAPVTVAVSLADKLDSLFMFFLIGEYPTGSKDPFALRRAALGIIQLILENNIRTTVAAWSVAIHKFSGRWDSGVERNPRNLLLKFLIDRLKVQQREAGVRHDIIDAAAPMMGLGDIVLLANGVHALQAFMANEDGENLLAGYKRAANILKKEGFSSPANAGAQDGEGPSGPGLLRSQENKTLSYTPEEAETALIAALDSAEPRAAAAVDAEDFEGAMAALALLRAPIDAFFDTVTVNDPAPEKREARLALLARMRDAVHRVADFGKIEG